MNQKTIILIVVLFVLIISGMFIFAGMKKSELTEPAIETQQDSNASEEAPYPGITRIDAKHYYIDGVHTLVGELNMPTPCDLLQYDAVVMESYPELVRIDFNVINNADICAETITAQRFKVSAQASKDAAFTANLMGRELEVNLIPAPEGEVPDDFELFIKG